MAAKRNATPIWGGEDTQPHNEFNKDFILAGKWGKDLANLKAVLDRLIDGEPAAGTASPIASKPLPCAG